MPTACFYSLIERTADCDFAGKVPDLPEVTATGSTEDEVIRRLTQNLRMHLEGIVDRGLPMPAPRSADEFLRGNELRPSQRLLLLIV